MRAGEHVPIRLAHGRAVAAEAGRREHAGCMRPKTKSLSAHKNEVVLPDGLVFIWGALRDLNGMSARQRREKVPRMAPTANAAARKPETGCRGL